MNNIYRIIISASRLNIEDWTDLYRFIDSIYINDKEENKIDALSRLKKNCVKVDYASNVQFDAYKLSGKEVTNDILKQLGTYTYFSILYKKNDNNEEFTSFAPFTLLLHRFKYKTDKASFNLISLGIDTDDMPNQDIAKNFYFKFSNFFYLYNEDPPLVGFKTLYFYSEKNNKVFNLAGKGKETKYKGKPSRRFLPLLQITEDNYHSIFTTAGITSINNSKDYIFVTESVNKIIDEFKYKILKTDKTKLSLIINSSDSLFDQWLVNGYFYSYKPEELKTMSIDTVKRIIQTLQIYKNSIFELIQNIIFHGGKSGIFYCVFDKKENVSSYYQNKLPDMKNNESDVNRFMRVGIYDFHKTDFVSSFIKREWKSLTKCTGNPYSDLSFKDFFDTKSISTIGISRLDMRYAAHLGIKSFVKTVFKHNGYFCVESNLIVNNLNLKKRLTTIWDNKTPHFSPEYTISFAPGTHYEIILPVLPSDNLSISAPTLQRDTILNFRQTLQKQFKSDKSIVVVDLDFAKISILKNSSSKVEQLTIIADIGNNIIKSSGHNNDEIAINMNGQDSDHKLVFKILAYIQLTADNGFTKIILINVTETFLRDFCEILNPLLIDTNDDDIPIWSKNSAIILMSNKLHVQIICGKKKDELYSLNQEFQKYYGNNFTEKSKLIFNLANRNSKSEIDDKLKGFILPYDIFVKFNDGTTLFEKYSKELLKRNIISRDLGFLVNNINTYIGNKIIVKNYYEADLMFQNSFFAERFAFLIAKNISKLKGKDLVLIGYHQYSEFLLKAIKRIIDDKTVHIVIAYANDGIMKNKEEKDNRISKLINCVEKHNSNIDMSFIFDIDGDGDKLRERVLKFPEEYQFVTIVPIGATLSTNDKIIALFKLWHKQQNPHYLESPHIDFIYNHCVIIVRDKIGPKLTKLEKEQQWKEILFDQNLIETEFQNAKEIYYTIQIAKSDSDVKRNNQEIADKEIKTYQQESVFYDNQYAKSENWLKRLNDEVSFPKDWHEEKYVNFTENSSINSQNLMGFPIVSLCDESDHQIELERLFELRNDLYKGHFAIYNSHHKYFFNTDSFVRRMNSLFKKWLNSFRTNPKTKDIFEQNKLNILITPNSETESDFICAVNDYIFYGNALIVYLDVKNWRNNIVHKLSFLKNLDKTNVNFHFVDHTLLTGDTYHLTKSYLFSINGGLNPIKFESIITVINRLPYTKDKEIKNDVNNHLYTFINLYYPTSKLDGRECELCRLNDYYDDLNKKTVLDSCKLVIRKNVGKLICKSKRELEQCRDKYDSQKSKRDFIRLVMTHEIYYRISQIAWSQANSYNSTREEVYEELDAIYCKLCGIQHTGDRITKSIIDVKIDEWFLYKIEDEFVDLHNYYYKKLKTDKIIAFLKVISSPPLSKYIIIREYAHHKLLIVLNEIIYKKKEHTYDDLKIVKSILKSLSFLKSNALVRKDIIVGAWKLLSNVIKQIEESITGIDNIEKNTIEALSITYAELEELNNKRQLTIFEGKRRDYLISIINKKNDYFKNLDIEKVNISRLQDENIIKDIIQDFSRDFQFFIKNAIVEDDAKATFLGELIRKGEEISSFDNISISKTVLSHNSVDNQDEKNDLFELFQDKIIYPEIFRKEYINFLVWLFFDNTTIIRRTLDNIYRELEKGNDYKMLFFNVENYDYKLKSINELKNDISDIYRKLKKKMSYEYYYSSFKPYLDENLEINYVKKLIYVTYAKLKLEDLINNKKKKDIETDIEDLLNVLSEIMGANAAFLTMKLDGESYPMAIYIDSKLNAVWKYDEWLFDDFLTNRYIKKDNLYYPIIPFYNVSEQRCGERRNRDLGAHSLNIFVIEDPIKQERAMITFLYKNNKNSLICDEKTFRICTQEFGRLLLLLKNEISEYVINFLVKDRVVDLWIEKQKNLRKYEKIYMESNHTFNAVYREMEEFEKLDNETLKQLFKTWFFLTNETISFFYSDIERNRMNGMDAHHCLSIGMNSVTSDDNTLGKTFNDKFIYILSCLLDDSWNPENKVYKESKTKFRKQKNMIFINDQDVHKFRQISDNLKDVPIQINKHLIRTIITQCVHNSLAVLSEHGHRCWSHIKKISINITPSSIAILESSLYKPSNIVLNKDVSFRMKKKHIKNINCNEYSSTTLTTIQGVINYLNCKQIKSTFDCDYGYDRNNNFFVTINF